MRKTKKRLEMGEDKWAEYQQDRKLKKAATWRKTNSQAVTDWRRRTKMILMDYKGGQCQYIDPETGEQCSFSDLRYPSCFDFHHIDPTTKEFAISANGRTKNIQLLKKEADKCLLLCRNCHAKMHENLKSFKRL